MKVQVQLASGPFRRTCWVDDDPRLKIGTQITLKRGGDLLWEILSVSSPQPGHAIHTDWKVGGNG